MISIQLPKIDLETEILVECFEQASEALDIVGTSIIPEALKQNILEKGRRGGMEEWLDVAESSLEAVRVVDPDYRRNDNLDEPLIDTGSLMNSAITTRDEFTIETTLSDYGFLHDIGKQVRPDGVKVPQREHMYIVEGEDTDAINAVFEEEFNK